MWISERRVAERKMSNSACGAIPRIAVYVSGISFRGMPVPFGSRKGPLFASSGIPGSDPETGGAPREIAVMAEFLAVLPAN